MHTITAGLVALSVVSLTAAQQVEWGQCGGINWTGPTTCVAGTVCTVLNPWYYQCLPGSTTPPPPPSTTSKPPTTTSKPPTTTSAPPPPPTTSSTAPPPPSGTGFVKTSGQKFMLNGAEYTVAGTNAYWLAQNSNADIDTAFADMAAAGLTTVRTWGFNDVTSPLTYGAYYQLWSNGVATFNTGAFGISRFDAVVASAKAHGIRLIVSLTNNWSDYGGMDVYVAQLNPGGTHDTFYTNPKTIAAFQNYIKNFVGRYANEPTIFGWELANEPRCGGSNGSPSAACDVAGSTINTWAKTISAYIKSIDPNHLVGLGDEGWFQLASPPTYPYQANVGIDFTKNLAISTLDFGTFHSYPESWGQGNNETLWGVDWITAHAAQQKAQNKPVLMEEFGVTVNQPSTYTLWWNTVLSSGLAGDLIWQAGSQLSTGPSPNDGYAVYPTGPVYPIMKSMASMLKARG
ncbi:CEL4a mannanase [Rickenella mellea]|uniref:mannan endo-1,4-beta-mannosidase n=1 Tax=Rickenella mellea TaxID=50990 RepID=A0A4Y7PJL8_9AGAM|nr:CEL4a mannanase [Rickenella mellea]